MRLLRAARAATFVYFGLNGFVLGIWIVHIPAIKQQAGVSDAVLGWLLLLLGLGAFIGMRRCSARPWPDRPSPATRSRSGRRCWHSGSATEAWT